MDPLDGVCGRIAGLLDALRVGAGRGPVAFNASAVFWGMLSAVLWGWTKMKEKGRVGKTWTAVLLALGMAAAVAAKGGPANVLAVFLAVGIGATCFALWGRSAFKRLAESSQRVAAANTSWRSFWVGLVNAVVAFLLFVLFAKAGQVFPPAGILAAAVVAGGCVLIFRGSLGVWPAYGHMILGEDNAPTELQATMAGGALLTGFLLFFPAGTLFFAYVLVRALGVAVLELVERKERQTA